MENFNLINLNIVFTLMIQKMFDSELVLRLVLKNMCYGSCDLWTLQVHVLYLQFSASLVFQTEIHPLPLSKFFLVLK